MVCVFVGSRMPAFCMTQNVCVCVCVCVRVSVCGSYVRVLCVCVYFMCVGLCLPLPLPRPADDRSPLQKEMARRLEERNKRHPEGEYDVSAAMDVTDDGETAAAKIVEKAVSVRPVRKAPPPPPVADQDAHHHVVQVAETEWRGMRNGIKAMHHRHNAGTADGEGARDGEVGAAPTLVKREKKERGSELLDGGKEPKSKSRDRRSKSPDGKKRRSKSPDGKRGASKSDANPEWASRWVGPHTLQRPWINACANSTHVRRFHAAYGMVRATDEMLELARKKRHEREHASLPEEGPQDDDPHAHSDADGDVFAC